MYAILIEDAISEKATVMSTLAADSMSAMILMLTTAEGWIAKQEVNLGYHIDQQDYTRTVTVTCGTDVVLSITAKTIDSVIGAPELRRFMGPESRH